MAQPPRAGGLPGFLLGSQEGRLTPTGPQLLGPAAPAHSSWLGGCISTMWGAASWVLLEERLKTETETEPGTVHMVSNPPNDSKMLAFTFYENQGD